MKANIIESIDEVKNREARERIAAGEAVAGWYSGRQVYLYMPNIKGRREIELTYVHEVVAHHGVKAIESLSQELNTPTEVVTDIESIADERKKRDAKKGMKGWFDPKTGKVVVILPNVSDTQDAVETMLHEAVGHRGLRALFGKRYNDFLNQVFAYGSLYL